VSLHWQRTRWCRTGLSGTYLTSDGAIVGCTELAKSQQVNFFFCLALAATLVGCPMAQVKQGTSWLMVDGTFFF